MRSTYAEINLSNLKYNYLNIRKKANGSKIMAVVKADAYGHGMIECVKKLSSIKSGSSGILWSGFN
ncbi:MAG: alanine racemase [Melioribacteraceae bacterium]|nr:alanine racemase [Melioribacteraceae bacterium]